MRPNLERISPAGDARARRILTGAPDSCDEHYLASITPQARLDLARFGVRRTTIALRRQSVGDLTDALWATALGVDPHETDGRDVLVGLALPHVVAGELGADPAGLFASTADRVPGSPVARTLLEFGSRRDVTLSAFGWALVQTPQGPDFIPA